MAMIKCTACGAEISDTAMSCPKCGANRWLYARGFSGCVVAVGIGIALLIIVPMLFGLCGGCGDVPRRLR
jgi:hypothetical protein